MNTEGAALKIQQCNPFVFLRHIAINTVKVLSVAMEKQQLPYFPAHKTHRDFFVRNFRKK